MADSNERASNGKTRGGSDWRDFVHTGPDTAAGRYLRRFWQPVAVSQDLPAGRATPIRIMSEDFTLYRGEPPLPLGAGGPRSGLRASRQRGDRRGEGKPHLLAFRCAHRGTQLSTGWVEGDNLRCFYHGWTYDPSGQCVEQPAEPEPFCQKVRIRSYPTQEYLGLIFCYLGEGEPPALPRYPDFEVDGVAEISAYVQPFNYFQTLENDPVHGAFVHRKPGLPRGEYGHFPRVAAEETLWGMAEHRIWPDGEFRTSHHGMPNIRHNMKRPKTYPSMREAGWVDSLYWRLPVDDEHVLQLTVDLAHVTGPDVEIFRERRAAWLEMERTFSPFELGDAVLAGRMRADELNDYADRTNITNAQDYVAQMGQGPIADRAHEHLGRTDAGLILFRNLWTRELRALAEGRPLKEWVRSGELVAKTSEYASSSFRHRD